MGVKHIQDSLIRHLWRKKKKFKLEASKLNIEGDDVQIDRDRLMSYLMMRHQYREMNQEPLEAPVEGNRQLQVGSQTRTLDHNR